MTPAQAKEYLNSFINYEVDRDKIHASTWNLKRMTRLLDLVGNPQKDIDIIHIAGTKGKGSTCAFTANILNSAGYRVGLYTSPHFNDYKERIRILGRGGQEKEGLFEGAIKERELCRLVERTKPKLEILRADADFGILSFFEVLTALALVFFREQRVDCAVLETGLGGRLDATNAAESIVCGITPISLDHTELLGLALKEIASEKAAIIKDRRQKVIVAPQEKEAEEVISKRCASFGIQPVFIGKDIHYSCSQNGIKGQIISIQGARDEYKNIKMQLLGKHQAANAAVAVGMVEALGEFGLKINSRAIKEGIGHTRWPGRFEIIKKNPFVVLDGAHNPGSCRVLAETIKDIFPGKKVTLVLGISSDKDVKGICAELDGIAGKVILTRADHPRAFEFNRDNSRDLFSGKNISRMDNIQEAIQSALGMSEKNEVILITGSLFVVAQARRLCIDRI
ncbi:MAG TPA: folylpolyglutamate synthase/dihydrofolate synthase family protein [Candidatus Omnitrophota bacterium]|nr:folylpolyglutamate synthase/dihydrofolate synthase family protein [Candidatus Omnitrophota bacterium]HPD84460.1 folylpolyglutamate synthase/dihydrofolate synthase family protein [Candidatus Omnitrophota bacterium]HRZ03318.1 folylpolyglutamate synthase/dihydrofolate synthase family protein [Candidatus Omnitrophota bacterium]